MEPGKDKTEELLNAVMPFAVKMLEEHGEFFPYGGLTRPNGEIAFVAGHDGREHPPSQELIELLAEGLRQSATDGEAVTTAIIFDVSVIPPGQSEKVSAIAAELEHMSGFAVTVFFPYRLRAGSVDIGEPFAADQRRGIFDVPDRTLH